METNNVLFNEDCSKVKAELNPGPARVCFEEIFLEEITAGEVEEMEGGRRVYKFDTDPLKGKDLKETLMTVIFSLNSQKN